jgi:hypothetical protein
LTCVSLASDPDRPKKTFDIGTGAFLISRSDNSAGISLLIDENAWQ